MLRASCFLAPHLEASRLQPPHGRLLRLQVRLRAELAGLGLAKAERAGVAAAVAARRPVPAAAAAAARKRCCCRGGGGGGVAGENKGWCGGGGGGGGGRWRRKRKDGQEQPKKKGRAADDIEVTESQFVIAGKRITCLVDGAKDIYNDQGEAVGKVRGRRTDLRPHLSFTWSTRTPACLAGPAPISPLPLPPSPPRTILQ